METVRTPGVITVIRSGAAGREFLEVAGWQELNRNGLLFLYCADGRPEAKALKV